MTDKQKKMTRDIQERTDWAYQATRFLVRMLGYERVSREVDDAQEKVESLPAPDKVKAMDELFRKLNAESRATQRERKAEP